MSGKAALHKCPFLTTKYAAIKLYIIVCLYSFTDALKLSFLPALSDGHNQGLTIFTVCQTECLRHFPYPSVVKMWN